MLTCVHCKTPVAPDEAKIFAQVFVCPICFGVAEALHNRGKREVLALFNMMEEAIRIALIEGRLQLTEQSLQEVSKTDLLRTIVDLQEKQNASRGRLGHGNSEDKPEGQ